MKLKVKIESIGDLREGTSKNGFPFAVRTIGLSSTEDLGESKKLKHSFVCDIRGDFAREFPSKVETGKTYLADLRFAVEQYNFRSYQRVTIDTIDVESLESSES